MIVKNYIVNIPIICGIVIIGHKGDILTLDENEAETKILMAQKYIELVEKPVIKTTKTKK